jgi:hypothetical protein
MTDRAFWLITGLSFAVALGASIYGIYFIMNCEGVVVRGAFYPPLVCIELKKITDRFPQ